MTSLENITDIELKFSLSEADLRSVLQGRFPLQPALEHNFPSGITAQFSSFSDTIILSGLIRRGHLASFLLKPGSRSYRNFLRFMLRELRDVREIVKGSNGSVEGHDEARTTVEGLTEYLQTKLGLLEHETEERVSNLNDVIEVFGADVQVSRPPIFRRSKSGRIPVLRVSPSGGDSEQRRAILQRINLPEERRFRVIGEDDARSQVMSGLLSLEIDEVRRRAPFPPETLASRVSTALQFSEPPVIREQEDGFLFSLRFRFAAFLLPYVEAGVRWGSYDGDESWIDEEVFPSEIHAEGGGMYRMEKLLRPLRGGRFGATAWIRPHRVEQRYWLGQAGIADARFEVSRRVRARPCKAARDRLVSSARHRGEILRAVGTYGSFSRTLHRLFHRENARALERTVHEVTSNDPELRQLVAEYYSRAKVETLFVDTNRVKRAVRSTLVLLENIGIGEVVLISPEGPHAIAGGIAQVISGLLDALARHGLSLTLIAPLYEEAQGNKHRCAERLIREGMVFNNETVLLHEVGGIQIPFGPVYRSGTEEVIEAPFVAACRVYRADAGRVRFLFLRHHRFADRLYPPVAPDEQLRRSIFLSRGALEVLCDTRFEVEPSIVISNDWLAGPVPLFLKTDPRYSKHPRLSRAKTVHVLHNCGTGYQGRFYTNYFGKDLWPLFGLGPEHYFGVADPGDASRLNLTGAAVYHTTGAILTVSRPYAEQLLNAQGADGLEQRIRSKQELLFGISNGVDLITLRHMLWEIGERARSDGQLSPLIPDRMSERQLLKNLPAYKEATKASLEKRYGLSADRDAILISLIGRITEQKGILLLDQRIPGEGVTPLESILMNYPEVEILIGGPITPGDLAAERFRRLSEKLEQGFPRRFRAIFDFIPHRDAMEITAGSDLFLMPSRYEPGGITQLEALAVGTLVVARNVGGISATLVNYQERSGEGNSFLFEEYSPRAFRKALASAIEVISNPRRRRQLMLRAAVAEHGWEHRVPYYLALLQFVGGVIGGEKRYPHLEIRERLLEAIRPRNLPL